LWDVAFCAKAAPAVSVIRPADSNTSERRMNISHKKPIPALQPLPLFSFAVRRNCYSRARRPGCYPPKFCVTLSQRLASVHTPFDEANYPYASISIFCMDRTT
jgi:hypothetical protein